MYQPLRINLGLPWWTSDKASACQGRRLRRCSRRGFNPWVGKIPWRRKWQATPVFLPGESHGQRSLGGYSPWGRTESDLTEHVPRRCAGHWFSFTSAWRWGEWDEHIDTKSASFLCQWSLSPVCLVQPDRCYRLHLLRGKFYPLKVIRECSLVWDGKCSSETSLLAYFIRMFSVESLVLCQSSPAHLTQNVQNQLTIFASGRQPHVPPVSRVPPSAGCQASVFQI